ncbi:hypothetical protein Bca4012_036692 [Brassica carinata]
MKFRLLKRCYDELDPFTSREKIKHFMDKFYKLFEEYRKKYPLTPVVSSTRIDSRVAKRGRGNLDVQDNCIADNGEGEMVIIRSSPNEVEDSGSSQRTENLEP